MRYFTVFVRQRKYDGGDIKISEAKSYYGSVQTPNNYRDIKAYGERTGDNLLFQTCSLRNLQELDEFSSSHIG